jgi:hypothetical protein
MSAARFALPSATITETSLDDVDALYSLATGSFSDRAASSATVVYDFASEMVPASPIGGSDPRLASQWEGYSFPVETLSLVAFYDLASATPGLAGAASDSSSFASWAGYSGISPIYEIPTEAAPHHTQRSVYCVDWGWGHTETTQPPHIYDDTAILKARAGAAAGEICSPVGLSIKCSSRYLRSRRLIVTVAVAIVSIAVIFGVIFGLQLKLPSSTPGTAVGLSLANCAVSPWSAWGGCSVTCGGGNQTQSRNVTTNPANGGTVCPALNNSRSCNTDGCPVNCEVSPWSAWGGCSVTCGGGNQTQSRNVSTNPANGGTVCPALNNSRSCNTNGCPVNCEVSPWSAWGGCSVTCGGGSQTQNRIVTSAPLNGGTVCPALSNSRSCNTNGCPVNCVVSQWSVWGGCSATCGGGSQTQNRIVTTAPLNGGTVCPALSNSRSCNTNGCPVNCVVSQWSVWGGCSATCGGGSQTQNRMVTTAPVNGGVVCPPLTNSRTCNTQACWVLECFSVMCCPWPATPFVKLSGVTQKSGAWSGYRIVRFANDGSIVSDVNYPVWSANSGTGESLASAFASAVSAIPVKSIVAIVIGDAACANRGAGASTISNAMSSLGARSFVAGFPSVGCLRVAYCGLLRKGLPTSSPLAVESIVSGLRSTTLCTFSWSQFQALIT